MNPELFTRLSKIKALADRGIGGEADNALRLFQQILSANGLTVADFEREGEQEIEFKIIIRKTDPFWPLFNQIIHSLEIGLFGYVHNLRGDRKHTQILKGTASKIEDFKLRWEIYREALKEEQDATYLAFLYKNKIFPPKSGETKQKEERTELTKAEKKALARMMEMEKVQLQKRLS